MSAILAPAPTALAPDVSCLIEVDGATRIYGSDPPVTALRNVSLRAEQGEGIAVIGPSGSGKTTLLQLIGTLDRPTSGAVRIAGLDTRTMSDDALSALRAHAIGFVFQQFFLSEHSSALDNVADGLLYLGISLAERRERAMESLDRVALGHRAHARPTQLSGGERQRVAIARALVGRPAIVLADEPTGNLDSTTGRSILSLIHELRDDGATVILVTHDRSVAKTFPRQVEMLDGAIVRDRSVARAGEDTR